MKHTYKIDVEKSREDLATTLRWIIERIEAEADRGLMGKRSNYGKAAVEVVNEAYGALARLAHEIETEQLAAEAQNG